MDYFPIFTQLKGRPVLVVGAGEIAARKIDLLQRAGASITVLARQIGPQVKTLARQNPKIQLHQAEYQSHWIDGQYLIIAATHCHATNRQIAADAERQQRWVNVVDNTELCSFITPAIIDRGDITVAVSSGGKAPVLSRLIRAKIESLLPARLAALVQLADQYRQKVKTLLPAGKARKEFWERVFNGVVAEKVYRGELAGAENALQSKLNRQRFQTAPSQGEVYLVGAGPGDPELLTFRALRLLQQADLVVYDRLVSPQVLDLSRRDAEKIYVGKEKSAHSLPQDQINQLLIERAQAGQRVVRLKGGDPYVFGRGGEEAQELIKAGISFQVVPGITSAAGAASYCGIPLTHRDYAQSVTFATGHLKEGHADLNWPMLAHAGQTLVIYMGLGNLPEISRQLQAHGRSGTTPVAVIENATRDNEKVVIGTLQNIDTLVKASQIQSPALIIVGEVVALRQQLLPDERLLQTA